MSERVTNNLNISIFAALKLSKTTKVANVVKPIEVKNNVYVMEKAKGISLKQFQMRYESFSSKNEQELEKLINDTPELKNRLTDRELEVLGLLVKGRTHPEIAKELFVSANTVKAHVGSIITKLDVSDRVQAVVKALQLRLIK